MIERKCRAKLAQRAGLPSPHLTLITRVLLRFRPGEVAVALITTSSCWDRNHNDCKIGKWDAKIQNALQQNGGYMHEQFHMGCKVNGQWVNSNAFSLWVRALALLPLSPPSPLLPWQMDFGFREALTVMYLLRTKSSKGQIETERLSPGHTETLRRWLFQYLKSCYGDGGRLNSQGKIKSSRWKCIPAFPKSFEQVEPLCAGRLLCEVWRYPCEIFTLGP